MSCDLISNLRIKSIFYLNDFHMMHHELHTIPRQNYQKIHYESNTKFNIILGSNIISAMLTSISCNSLKFRILVQY